MRKLKSMCVVHNPFPRRHRRVFVVLAVCTACVVGPMPARAEDTSVSAAPVGTKTSTPSAMVSLINRLASRGLLTKQDAEDLTSMAEADAADARVEIAETRLAAAKAEAAAARARAALARANAELVLARASAAQLAANQNAAVRLLLGKGQADAAAAQVPAAQESGAPVTAAPISSGNPPAEESAPDAAAVPEQPAPERRVAREVPEPAGDTPAATVEAEAAPAPMSAAEAPVNETPSAGASAAPTTLKLARNEDGAIIVPEEADGGQAKSTSVHSDAGDSSAPAQEEASDANPAGPEKPEMAKADDSAAPDAGTQVPPEAEDAAKSDAAKMGGSAPSDSSPSASPEPEAAKTDDSAAPDSQPSVAPEAPVADTAAAAPDNAAASPEASDASAQSNDEAAPQPAESVKRAAPPKTAAEAPVSGDSNSPSGETAAESMGSSDDVVRVAYVPEVVKKQLREEVKNEVIAEARKENWGAPSSGPEWVSKFTLYGDIRVRAEEVINHAGNNDTGAFPNFNAINTGAPFDTAGNVFSPQYDVDQNRNRERLRARLGAAVDVSGGFTAGLRFATGNDNNPVTENQTFGAAGNAQGGDFSKYSVWIDRAFIKYETGADQGPPFWMTFGRFDNPFFSTSLIWANDIGFDGVAASIPLKAFVRGRPSDDFKPFLVAGAFPVFNTDLNYATNSPTKLKSYDKWLYAGQLGFDAKLSGDFQLKAAAALYEYKNIQGQLSDPFTPLTTSDAGDTDASRPSFAQNGNTYMAIRDITPGPLNDNGTIDQFQYYGLATPFKDFALTEGLYYNHFEPFQISLVSEWVRNLAFNRAAVAAVAVNNGGSSNYIGGNTGWISTLKFGSGVIHELGDWNASVGYRKVETDAVVDGFNDADFGGVLFGTNLKGFTLTASLGLARDVWVDVRWMSASAIAGPTFKNDLLQVDLDAKF